ncbi:MAG: hypothetical protein KDK99_18705 [Verrucomicrobiales bacterium]|nr:hypothetical protein [Verrucomicrobiales bacterium]
MNPLRIQLRPLPRVLTAGLLLVGLPPVSSQAQPAAPGSSILTLDESGHLKIIPEERSAIDGDHAADSSGRLIRTRGPWGNLEGAFVFIEAPQSIVDAYPIPDRQTRWAFPLDERPRLQQQLEDVGLDPRLVQSLLSSDRLRQGRNHLYLLPTVDEVVSIDRDTRSRLCALLAEFPTNPQQQNPLIITGRSVQTFFRTSPLRSELVDMIDRLSYSRGSALVFSDLSILVGMARTDAEVKLIAKSMTRARAAMLHLVVEPTTRIQDVLAYWTLGSGFRTKDVEPILQSIAATDGIDSLPIGHLLPPVPRKLLYTFASPDYAKYGSLPDCHWTTLNFFRTEPQAYYLDADIAINGILTEHERVEGEPSYGDVLFFRRVSTGLSIHSCIYLAGGFVFTKNGLNMVSPWTIMPLNDVKDIYLTDDARMEILRRKNLPDE